MAPASTGRPACHLLSGPDCEANTVRLATAGNCASSALSHTRWKKLP